MHKIFSEETGQSEWSSLYLLLVFIIAALLLITLIKPMFRQSQTVVRPLTQGAQQTAKFGSS
ncbi:MAG TPA: hypothetical protein VJK05_03730 [archaeon]|nr:hypothetical protein [archaeon]